MNKHQEKDDIQQIIREFRTNNPHISKQLDQYYQQISHFTPSHTTWKKATWFQRVSEWSSKPSIPPLCTQTSNELSIDFIMAISCILPIPFFSIIIILMKG